MFFLHPWHTFYISSNISMFSTRSAVVWDTAGRCAASPDSGVASVGRDPAPESCPV
jgi:hypothetical protein